MIPYLASLRHANGPLRPPTPGNIALSGNLTSSKTRSHWIEERIENLPVMSLAEKPGVPVGTTKPRTRLSCSSVLAQITATSAMEPIPIQRFDPLSTQSDPSRLARVFMLEGSLPAEGSVRPKQPMASPFAILGSHSSLCSSEPNLWIADIVREPCTETKVRRPESPASSSMHASP